jgi:hypothetical protein
VPTLVTPYQVFVHDTVDHPCSLPEQAFVPTDFEFLFTVGGNLVENEEEFNDFLALINELGEKQFLIQEHCTQLGRTIPFAKKFSVQTNYNDFEREIRTYSAFGLQVASWYIYGNNRSWGIYLAEQPAINIIGCKQYLADKFRQVFKVSNSGYSELKDFVRQEFRSEELTKQFEANYKVNGA